MSAKSPAPENAVASPSREEVPSLDSSTNSLHSSPARRRKHLSPAARWANRVAMILFVSLCASFGVLMVILPWTPKWTDNYLLISYPSLRDFLENGFVRGVCTGLGLVDIWIGFSEASHYGEPELRS